MEPIESGNSIYSEGVVCGRFQPPHNDHLEYITEAKKKCKFLWVGVVRPDIRVSVPCKEALHRDDRESNPLTYFERVRILTQMLTDHGVSRSEFACIPFPLDEPRLVPDFIDPTIPCFTTICDEWNRAKIRKLEEIGFRVDILFERKEKHIEGRSIRSLVLANNPQWRLYVPRATIEAIERINLTARLKLLTQTSGS